MLSLPTVQYSLLSAAHGYDVVSFEINPANLIRVCESMHWNQLYSHDHLFGRIHLFRNGVSSVHGTPVQVVVPKRNPGEAKVLPFENDVVKVDLNPFDSVMTNARKLASLPCGGTNCSAPLKWINKRRLDVSVVIFVSDNESWIDSKRGGQPIGERS